MLKKLLSETVLYGGTHILARIVNYALVPLHTGAFVSESYGIVADYYAMAALLNVVYTYGMETTFFRFTNKKGHDPLEVFRSTATSLLITTAIFSGLIIGFSSEIAGLLGYEESSHYVEWFGWLIGIDTLAVIPFAWLRFRHKAVYFVSLKISNILINVGLNYFFLWYCPAVVAAEFTLGASLVNALYDPELGKGYVFLSNLAANAIYLPLLLPVLKHWRFRFRWNELKEYYLYGLPLLISGVAYAINETADRIFLKYWLPEGFYENLSSLGAVGVYNACYKLSIFITLAVQGFKYAAEPFFFSQASNKNSPEVFARVMKFFVLTTLSMMLIVVANLGWIAPIFLQREVYLSGLSIVPILLLANIFLGMYYNLSIWFKITDKTNFGAYISIAGALLTIAANLLLIPILGYTGSAIATLICYFFITAISYQLGQKHFPIPYPIKSIGIYFLLFTGLTFGMPHFPFTGWTAIFINNALCLLLIGFAGAIEWRRFNP